MGDYTPRRMYLKLTTAESRALGQLAEIERRHPRDQAALLIRQRLIELGLLKQTEPESQAAPVVERN